MEYTNIDQKINSIENTMKSLMNKNTVVYSNHSKTSVCSRFKCSPAASTPPIATVETITPLNALLVSCAYRYVLLRH